MSHALVSHSPALRAARCVSYRTEKIWDSSTPIASGEGSWRLSTQPFREINNYGRCTSATNPGGQEFVNIPQAEAIPVCGASLKIPISISDEIVITPAIWRHGARITRTVQRAFTLQRMPLQTSIFMLCAPLLPSGKTGRFMVTHLIQPDSNLGSRSGFTSLGARISRPGSGHDYEQCWTDS